MSSVATLKQYSHKQWNGSILNSDQQTARRWSSWGHFHSYPGASSRIFYSTTTHRSSKLNKSRPKPNVALNNKIRIHQYNHQDEDVKCPNAVTLPETRVKPWSWPWCWTPLLPSSSEPSRKTHRRNMWRQSENRPHPFVLPTPHETQIDTTRFQFNLKKTDFASKHLDLITSFHAWTNHL